MHIALLGPAISIHLQRWARALAGRGNRISLMTQHPCDAHVLPADVEQIVLPHSRALGYVRNASALRRILQARQVDLLNTHYATGYGTLARLCGWQPHLLSVWGSDVYDFPAKSPLHRWWLRGNLAASTALASTSQCMAQHTTEIFAGRRIFITPFGVDTGLFSPGQHTHGDRADGSIVTIGTVKTLEAKYGIDTLIEAFALAQRKLAPQLDLRLEITGEGAQKAELQALAYMRGVGQAVVLHDAVAHAQVPGQLRRLDIFAALSRMESFGVAAVEAAACGLPVVGSDAPGLAEVTQHRITGLVVPRNNPHAAAAAFEKLALDAALRQKMGAAGRAHVLACYDWAHCVALMEQAYAATIAKSSKR